MQNAGNLHSLFVQANAPTAGQRDAVLLRAARRDPEAFRDFYRLHAEWVYRWLLTRVDTPQEAVELTAETFAQALVALPRFRGTEPGSGTAWLFGIARNLVRRSYERGQLERRARERLGMPARQYVAPEYEEVEEQADAAALAAEIAAALDGLTPELREALELRILHELSYEELARSSGISEPNARLRVSRALRAMRRRLETAQGKDAS